MSHCPRCDTHLGFWDVPVCNRCRYPEADSRDAVTIAADDADYRERMQDNDDDLPSQS